MAGEVHTLDVGCASCALEARRQARKAQAEAEAITDPERWETKRELLARARAAERTAELFETMRELAL